jgi:hypothetical protein
MALKFRDSGGLTPAQPLYPNDDIHVAEFADSIDVPDSVFDTAINEFQETLFHAGGDILEDVHWESKDEKAKVRLVYYTVPKGSVALPVVETGAPETIFTLNGYDISAAAFFEAIADDDADLRHAVRGSLNELNARIDDLGKGVHERLTKLADDLTADAAQDFADSESLTELWAKVGVLEELVKRQGEDNVELSKRTRALEVFKLANDADHDTIKGLIGETKQAQTVLDRALKSDPGEVLPAKQAPKPTDGGPDPRSLAGPLTTSTYPWGKIRANAEQGIFQGPPGEFPGEKRAREAIEAIEKMDWTRGIK